MWPVKNKIKTLLFCLSKIFKVEKKVEWWNKNRNRKEKWLKKKKKEKKKIKEKGNKKEI
jgi:hypothetical protein